MPPIVFFLAIGIGVASFVAFAVMSMGSSNSAADAEDRLDILANRKQSRKASSSLLLSSDFTGWENHLNQLAKKIPNVSRYLGNRD